MKAITGPATDAIFNAVSTSVTKEGIKETAPQNDAEGAHVGNNAAALAEAGNLLMMSGRAVDNADWVKIAGELTSAANTALKAADAKDKEAIVLAGGTINETCDSCHARYQRQ